MENTFIIANWKSNKTEKEAADFIDDLASKKLDYSNKKVVICPSFTLLKKVSEKIKEHGLPIEVGGQNVSPFEEGPFTGEVNARQLAEFAGFCVVGHSERRRNFSETEDLINDKIIELSKFSIIPLVCISSLQEADALPQNSEESIICFEPLEAIGSGKPQTPQAASEIAKKVKAKRNVPVLYGGSVDSKNVSAFTRAGGIEGVLVGGASLDSSEFAALIENA